MNFAPGFSGEGIIMEQKEKINSNYRKLSNSIRVLSADAVEKANSGHPGLPLGFSDVFTVLVTKFLKYIPQNPRWFGRDRLILSAGHGSMLLYSFYYLAGFLDYNLENLQNFRQFQSKTPGHPEYDCNNPIETTTGPLGQGFANSVGICIAQKKYQQKWGDLGKWKTYCIVGDGCLMEGISHEAASLAGHLKLGGLIVLFDDNQISIDGPTNLTTSDDHLAKFRAFGWGVESIDGHDFDAINSALSRAQNSEIPYLIACKTKIGYGAGAKEGTEKCHGSALGKEYIDILKKNLAWPEEPFFIPSEYKKLWEESWIFNKNYYKKWTEDFKKLDNEQQKYLKCYDSKTSELILPFYESEATRVSAGKLLEQLLIKSEKIIIGSADLSHSNCLYSKTCKPITSSDFSGNFIHYGVRENAMSAIMNGLATQNFLPIGGTFLVFSDYMRPSIRLSAIMRLPCIYVMTHDSIGVGEDGPTHQPVEHLASLRAMPGLNIYRPADALEVEVCINMILASRIPSILALTRQTVHKLEFSEIRKKNMEKGAYIIDSDIGNIDVSIWATGSEVNTALEVKKLLNKATLKVRIISAPSIELFFSQGTKYKNKLLNNAGLIVAVEAAAKFGWERVIGGNGMFFGVNDFGISAPCPDVYSYFGITAQNIANKIIERLHDKNWN